MITRRLQISGKVQGVGYRDALLHEARRLGLAGWVRNRLDGSVEVLVQGAANPVDEIIAWARRGPRAARVDDVHVECTESIPDFAGFERRPTA